VKLEQASATVELSSFKPICVCLLYSGCAPCESKGSPIFPIFQNECQPDCDCIAHLAEFFHGADADDEVVSSGTLLSVVTCTRVTQKLLALDTTMRRPASAFLPFLLLFDLLLLLLLLLVVVVVMRRRDARCPAGVAVSRRSRVNRLDQTSQQVIIRQRLDSSPDRKLTQLQHTASKTNRSYPPGVTIQYSYC